MKSIFISDLHLGPHDLDVYQAFRNFLHALPEDVEELFILGDLFEAWIGDDDISDFAAVVKNDLYNLSRRGISLKIQHGNRDFLLGKRFSRETGAKILPDYFLYDHRGQKALLMHGDLLCTDDVLYQRFRRKVHNPLYNFVVRNLPLTLRQKIADKWRDQSKDMNKNKPENIMDVNTSAVTDVMQKYSVETLIHGHTHRPAVHQLGNDRTRIVLGDWGEKIWWVSADINGFALLSQPVGCKNPF